MSKIQADLEVMACIAPVEIMKSSPHNHFETSAWVEFTSSLEWEVTLRFTQGLACTTKGWPLKIYTV